MCLHMLGLQFCEFLTCELLCPPSPTAPAQTLIPKQTIDDMKEKVLVDYDDRLTLLVSHMCGLRLGLMSMFRQVRFLQPVWSHGWSFCC
jgi:hypothetical protein